MPQEMLDRGEQEHARVSVWALRVVVESVMAELSFGQQQGVLQRVESFASDFQALFLESQDSEVLREVRRRVEATRQLARALGSQHMMRAKDQFVQAQTGGPGPVQAFDGHD
jgi:hypothetical protein